MPSRVRGKHRDSASLLTSNCGTEGALGEILVAADLMQRGYQVFRALSPASDYDLIAVHGARLLKVEVTKGWRDDRSGQALRWHKHTKPYDLLAVWESNSVISYFPPLAS